MVGEMGRKGKQDTYVIEARCVGVGHIDHIDEALR